MTLQNPREGGGKLLQLCASVLVGCHQHSTSMWLEASGWPSCRPIDPIGVCWARNLESFLCGVAGWRHSVGG